jgi:hypothetical protein
MFSVFKAAAVYFLRFFEPKNYCYCILFSLSHKTAVVCRFLLLAPILTGSAISWRRS